VHRHCRPVGDRLVLVVDELGDERLEVARAYDQLVVVGAEELGHAAGVLELVEARVVEADRERLHGRVQQLAHQRDVRRRVDAAGEEDPERDVAHHPPPDGPAQQVEQPLR
jgi:hypothetical protein